jgi:hypothetical protein
MEIDAVDYEEFGELENTVQELEAQVTNLTSKLKTCLRILLNEPNQKKGGNFMCNMTREEVADYAKDNLDKERKYKIKHISQSAEDGKEYLIVEEV